MSISSKVEHTTKIIKAAQGGIRKDKSRELIKEKVQEVILWKPSKTEKPVDSLISSQKRDRPLNTQSQEWGRKKHPQI